MRIGSILIILVLLMSSLAPTYAQTGECVNKYMVLDNDSLSGIARRFNVDMTELAQANNIANPSYIQIGQILCLDGLVEAQPAPPTDETEGATGGTGGPVVTNPPTNVVIAAPSPIVTGPRPNASVTIGTRTYVTDNLGYYTVQGGDNLYRIALAWGVTSEQLAAVNGIRNANIVYLGQRLVIPIATPSQVVPGTIPAISIAPRTAGPGNSVTVEGFNYPPNTKVTLYLEKFSLNRRSNALGTVTTTATGSFSTTVTIPSTWPDNYAIDTRTVSISGYAENGVHWGTNFFINTAWKR